VSYRVVLADPAWQFRDRGSRLTPSHNGRHYQTETLEETCQVGQFLPALLLPDAFLFLWAPNALVLDGAAAKVITAWGFTSKQLIPWVKMTKDNSRPRIGAGHYTRVCTEQLILATRGRPKVKARNVPGVLIAPRSRHSAKPPEQYDLIERLADGPYLELYAREQRQGWDAIGDQLDC
jgi:N6-adenosine-specific RNA methylase IME4